MSYHKIVNMEMTVGKLYINVTFPFDKEKKNNSIYTNVLNWHG